MIAMPKFHCLLHAHTHMYRRYTTLVRIDLFRYIFSVASLNTFAAIAATAAASPVLSAVACAIDIYDVIFITFFVRLFLLLTLLYFASLHSTLLSMKWEKISDCVCEETWNVVAQFLNFIHFANFFLRWRKRFVPMMVMCVCVCASIKLVSVPFWFPFMSAEAFRIEKKTRHAKMKIKTQKTLHPNENLIDDTDDSCSCMVVDGWFFSLLYFFNR